MDQRQCRKCGETKDLGLFRRMDYQYKGRPFVSYSRICRACQAERQREWYRQNEPRQKVVRKVYVAKNKGRIRARRSAYWHANKERLIAERNARMAAEPLRFARYQNRGQIKQYGLSQERYDEMLVEQHGKCGICDKPMNPPTVDHCHTTGKIRGLLCRHCNKGIGALGDSVQMLESAIQYLRRSSGT